MQYPTPRTDYLAEKEKRKSMLDMDEEEKGTKAVRVLERKNKHCKRIDHSLRMLAYTYIHTYTWNKYCCKLIAHSAHAHLSNSATHMKQIRFLSLHRRSVLLLFNISRTKLWAYFAYEFTFFFKSPVKTSNISFTCRPKCFGSSTRQKGRSANFTTSIPSPNRQCGNSRPEHRGNILAGKAFRGI